jgi:hypothetical protein
MTLGVEEKVRMMETAPWDPSTVEVKRGRLLRPWLWLALSPIFLVVISMPATCAAQAPADDSQEYHIEVTGLASAACERLPRQLSAKNFAVSQNGHQYPVRVFQPLKTKETGGQGYPTHLLVVFPLNTNRPKDTDIVKSLRKALSEGWLVSVTRSDGRFTPYSTDAATLLSALAATAPAPMSAPEALRSMQAATIDLSWLPGRRLLLVVVDGIHAGSPLPWTILQTKVFSPVYMSDGGLGTSYSPPDSAHVSGMEGTTTGIKVRGNYNGVSHELNFKDAVKHILCDAYFDYDLVFTVQASQLKSGQPFTLTFHHATVLSPLKAEPYSIGMSTVHGEPVALRNAVAQKLIVEGK